MIIKPDGSVEFFDCRDMLKTALNGLTYKQTLDLWVEMEKEFQKQGIHADFYRNMALIDRYFLLINMLSANYALHPWVFDRCREVEKDPNDYLDLWAREHFKSTVITNAGCIQEILKDPEITIGIFSHTRGVAKKFLTQIKQDFEQKEIFHQVFPDIIWKNPKRDAPVWNKEKITVIRKGNPRESTVEAWGVVDGQPIGAHFKLRVYDDLVTPESVSTPEQIEKTTEMLSLSNNLGSDGGKQWFIGTRYSHADTYQSMMDKGQVKVRKYPATDDGTIMGNPVLFSREYWEEKKRNQSIATLSCQMLQNPSAGTQSLFDKQHFNPYKFRNPICNIYIMVDPSRGNKVGSDRTAMAVIAVTAGMNMYLVDGYNHRMTLSEKWEKLKGLHKKWSNTPGVQMVKVGYERYGMQADADHFKIMMDQTGYKFDIHELNWTKDGKQSKVDRMSRLEPAMRNKKLFLPQFIYSDGKEYEWRFLKEDKYKEAEWIKTKMGKTENDHLIEEKRKRPNIVIAEPIICIDTSDPGKKKIYDLTESFILQASMVPFASGHDDLVDAVSRIYDMEPKEPIIVNYSQSLPDPKLFES